MARLDGKKALITGGTSGIGLGIAERFLREGAAVVITGRDAALGKQAAERLGQHGEAGFVQADAADPAQVERSVEEAVRSLGALDILVNNAGITMEARALDTPLADYDRLMAVNVRGPFLYAKAAYAHLASRRGAMVHIASDAGVVGEQAIAIYSVSKAALIMLSKMLALDAAADGVRSNCISPGSTAPGMRHVIRVTDGQEAAGWSAYPEAPLGRIGQPEDIAAAALYLVSEESSFATGINIVLDGGIQAGIPGAAG